MGHSISFRGALGKCKQQQLYDAIREGDLVVIRRIVEKDQSQSVVNNPFLYRKTTPLQIAALHGELDVLTLLLESGADSNKRNTGDGQTPLMFACKGGDSMCVERLLQHDANALAFDSTKGRTCLHIACRRGHYDCVVKVLDAARKGPISTTWGFTRFVNVRDDNGAIPLHMAARAGHAEIVRLLLNNGALVTAVTCNSTYGPGHGSTPLHFAARSGSLDCVEELLAWGADRTQKDLMGQTPYVVAANRGNLGCAAILNPSAAEPMVWPSPLKFMRELEPETRSILQAALAKANETRKSLILQRRASKGRALGSLKLRIRRIHKKTGFYEDCSQDEVDKSPKVELQRSESSKTTCCICFDSFSRMIEVDECGHQMCAACTMALCCLSIKPNPSSASSTPSPPIAPSCPFCRRDIARLTVAKSPIKKLTPACTTSSGVAHQDEDDDGHDDHSTLADPRRKRSRSLRRTRSLVRKHDFRSTSFS